MKSGIPPMAWAVLIAVAAALVFGLLKAKTTGGRRATGALAAKTPLTEREQAMYWRLVKAFPEHVVLAQVAFSALLITKDRPTRATFDRKVADFVLCDKAFGVVAAIELDDTSHKGKAANDARRDELLSAGGVRVLRFKNVPDFDVLTQAVAKLAPQP